MKINSIFLCFSACLACSNVFSNPTDKAFSKGNFQISYPFDWQYTTIQQPNGAALDAFMAPDEKKAIAYCHVTQRKIDPVLMTCPP